jgi:hypothetical protein
MIVFDERVSFNLTLVTHLPLSARLSQAVTFMECNSCPLIGGDPWREMLEIEGHAGPKCSCRTCRLENPTQSSNIRAHRKGTR